MAVGQFQVEINTSMVYAQMSGRNGGQFMLLHPRPRPVSTGLGLVSPTSVPVVGGYEVYFGIILAG